jgi:UDP-N-acetylmuramoyl-tripeptide--D-alanyl-D-alanine ligase
VLGVDDPLVAAMRSRTTAAVIGFGISPEADVRVESLTLDAQARPRFRLVTPQGTAKIAMQLVGAHQAINAAAAAAVGLAAGMTLGDVTDGLNDVSTVSAHRMHVASRADGLIVIDDAYNANPESVRAALDALAVLVDGREGASWAVLGEMRELGPDGPDLHAAVGRHAASIGLDHLVIVGETAHAIAAGASSVRDWTGTVEFAPDTETATAMLQAEVGGADVVLVKASNAFRLWQVADALLSPVDRAPVEVAP